MTDNGNLATMTTDTVTPFGANDMGDQKLTHHGEKIAKAIEDLLGAVVLNYKLGACETPRKYEIAEERCRKRFRKLWKAIEKHGDCHLGDADNDEIKRITEIF